FAYFGRNAPARAESLVSLALNFRTLRSATDSERSDLGYEALYKQAKALLEYHTLQALWHDKPEILEDLAKAMRRVSRGELDLRIDKARAEILIHAAKGDLNIYKLAQELGIAERTLRRIKSRMLAPDR